MVQEWAPQMSRGAGDSPSGDLGPPGRNLEAHISNRPRVALRTPLAIVHSFILTYGTKRKLAVKAI